MGPTAHCPVCAVPYDFRVISLAEILRNNPELAVFLTLALGFTLGKLRLGSFQAGSVLGTLLAGVLIGQLGIKVPPVVKVIFFDLFLFATGYKVGPQFFRGLKKDALPQLVLTFVICTACLLSAIGVARVFGYDVGTAAGMLAGAFTESTVIGTASESIQRLALPDAEKLRLVNQIPVAYAVTYLVGTAVMVWLLSSLAPKLLRVDLRKASQDLEIKLSGRAAPGEGVESSYREWDLRAYKLSTAGWAVRDVEALFPGARVFVERIRRAGKIFRAEEETPLLAGDRIAVLGRREVLLKAPAAIGPELEDRELVDFPTVSIDVVLTRKDLAGLTLAQIDEAYGRGVVLRRLVRGGQEMPFEAGTILHRGDLLEITGHQEDAERAADALGYAARRTAATDMVFVGLGIVIGGLVGLFSVEVFGVSITLTTSGGALVMGLVFGWLRSVRPTFGGIPEAALWVFDTVGLTVFIGVVGLSAGPSFVSGLRQTGPTLLIGALLVAVVPHLLGLFVGRAILKMDPVILLGAQAGAGTTTAAL